MGLVWRSLDARSLLLRQKVSTNHSLSALYLSSRGGLLIKSSKRVAVSWSKAERT